MDSLDVIQIPTLKFLSSSSTNPSSGNSALPKTVNKILKKKLYKRTSSTGSSPRRSNTRKSSSAYRDRRQKWKSLYDKDGWKLQELFGKRRSRKTITSSDSTPSSARSSTPYTPNRSTSTISHEESLFVPGSRQSPIFIDSDDDESPSTPSPIRDSPSYGRNTRQTRINSNGTAPPPPIVYPELPTETPAAHFMLLYPKPLDDSTIDRKLIDEIRKGPTAEVRDRELCLLYTAALKGEDRYVKIGYTEDLQKRMNALSSPRGSGTIYSLDDFTPGAQSRFLNCHHAEKIIHLELYNRRHRFIEKNQTEWFELEVDEAHRVCRKWRNWFRLWAPYDENLQLNAFWRRRIDQIEAYDAAKHGSLHQRWSRVLDPSWWDRMFYKPIIILDALYKRWTWLCENPLCILAVQMLVSFIIYVLYGPLALCLTAASVLLLWSGLSKQTTAKTRKTRKRGPD